MIEEEIKPIDAQQNNVVAPAKVELPAVEPKVEDIPQIEINSVFEDETGNIVDKEGKILIETKDVKKDAEGNILFPSDFQAPKIENSFDNIRNLFTGDYGIELKDDEGNDLNFDLSNPDEQVKLIEFGVTKSAYALKEHLDNKLFKEFPDVKNYIELRQAGFSPEEIKSKDTSKWENVIIEKNNINQLKEINKQLLIKKGFSESKANNIINSYELNNILFEEGVDALTELQTLEKEEISNRQKNIDLQKQNDLEKSKEFVKDISTTINSRKFGNIEIGEKEAQPFIDYLFKPVDKAGNTKAMIDDKAMTKEQLIVLEYIKYKKMNLQDLVGLEVNRNTVKNVKAKIAKFERGGKDGERKVTTQSKGGVSDFSFNSMFN